MWGTSTRRWGAALDITRGDGCLLMRIGVVGMTSPCADAFRSLRSWFGSCLRRPAPSVSLHAACKI